jgi:hypothetical protein
MLRTLSISNDEHCHFLCVMCLVANDDITYILIPLSTSNDDYYYFYFYFPMLRISICLPPNLLLVPAMVDMVSGVASQGARPALWWSAAMSGFVLRRLLT